MGKGKEKVTKQPNICGVEFDKYAEPVPFGSETADGAVLACLMFHYVGFQARLGYAINIWTCVLSRFLQFVLIFQLFGSIDSMEDVYEATVYNKVSEIFAKAHEVEMTIPDMISGANPTASKGSYQWEAANFPRLFAGVHGMCSVQLFKPDQIIFITLMVLTLLFGKVISDLESITKTMVALFSLEERPDPDFELLDPVLDDEDDDETKKAVNDEIKLIQKIYKPPKQSYFTYCPHYTKWIALGAIYLPNLVVHLATAYLATKYVCVQPELNGIVKAVVKMYFIVKFDSFFFKFYASGNFQKFLSGASFLVLKEPKVMTAEDEEEEEQLSRCVDFTLWAQKFARQEDYLSWKGAGIRALAALLLAILALCVFFRKFMFAKLCDDYQQAFPQIDPHRRYAFGNLTYVGMNWTIFGGFS